MFPQLPRQLSRIAPQLILLSRNITTMAPKTITVDVTVSTTLEVTQPPEPN